ncbi:MAG: hypothetical protein HQK51_18725, partial [Oligoflexia bacterium]|nr:hypothetical protein [Oligoflexia bacterium]
PAQDDLEIEKSYQALIDHLTVIIKIVNPQVQFEDGQIALGPAEQLSLGLKIKGNIIDKDNPDKTFENALKEVSKIQDKWCKLNPIADSSIKEKLWKNYKHFLKMFLKESKM